MKRIAQNKLLGIVLLIALAVEFISLLAFARPVAEVAIFVVALILLLKE